MKKLMYIPLILGLFFTACKKEKKETVEEEKDETVELTYTSTQNAIIQDFTSTGCPGCGSWGAPTFDKFFEDNPSVIPIAVHIKYNDPMITTESVDLGNNRTGNKWTPQISIGNEQCVLLTPNNYIDGNASVAKLNTEFNKIVSNAPVISVAANYKIENESVVIDYGAQFLEALSGEYFVSTLVMENGYVFKQSNGGDNFVHNHVIRKSHNGVFGSLIPSDKLVEGEKYELESTIEIDPSWDKDKLYVIAIVWKKNGGIYEYVNASTAIKL